MWKMAAQLMPVHFMAIKNASGSSALAPFSLLFAFTALTFFDQAPDLLAALVAGLPDGHLAGAFALFHDITME